jgi:hypothetical protein
MGARRVTMATVVDRTHLCLREWPDEHLRRFLGAVFNSGGWTFSAAVTAARTATRAGWPATRTCSRCVDHSAPPNVMPVELSYG